MATATAREYLVEPYSWNHANLSSQDVINQKLEIKVKRRWKLFPYSTQNYVVLNAYKSKPSDILLLFRIENDVEVYTSSSSFFPHFYDALFTVFPNIKKN